MNRFAGDSASQRRFHHNPPFPFAAWLIKYMLTSKGDDDSIRTEQNCSPAETANKGSIETRTNINIGAKGRALRRSVSRRNGDSENSANVSPFGDSIRHRPRHSVCRLVAEPLSWTRTVRHRQRLRRGTDNRRMGFVVGGLGHLLDRVVPSPQECRTLPTHGTCPTCLPFEDRVGIKIE